MYYEWGDQSIDKSTTYDVIHYTNDGKIAAVTSYVANFTNSTTATATYNGNTITLDKAYSEFIRLIKPEGYSFILQQTQAAG